MAIQRELEIATMIRPGSIQLYLVGSFISIPTMSKNCVTRVTSTQTVLIASVFFFRYCHGLNDDGSFSATEYFGKNGCNKKSAKSSCQGYSKINQQVETSHIAKDFVVSFLKTFCYTVMYPIFSKIFTIEISLRRSFKNIARRDYTVELNFVFYP